MHYDVDNIYMKDGIVYLYCAESGKERWGEHPLYGFEGMSTYKQLAEVGRGLYEGSFQFLKRTECRAKAVYDNCKRRHGTLRDHPGDDRKKYRERFASEFARRMCA